MDHYDICFFVILAVSVVAIIINLVRKTSNDIRIKFTRGTMKTKLSHYKTPEDYQCPHCQEYSEIIPRDNAFYYAGSHHGPAGTHYPSNYGEAMCSCCEASVDAEEYYGF